MPDRLSRVVIVHTAEQVRAALEAASEPYTPIALQSAAGANAYAGSLYLLHMFAQVKADFPKTEATFILDCGDSGADAIAAMEMGHSHIRTSAPDTLRTKLEDIAKQYKITLVTSPFDALDLHRVRDAKAACKKWLVEKIAG